MALYTFAKCVTDCVTRPCTVHQSHLTIKLSNTWLYALASTDYVVQFQTYIVSDLVSSRTNWWDISTAVIAGFVIVVYFNQNQVYIALPQCANRLRIKDADWILVYSSRASALAWTEGDFQHARTTKFWLGHYPLSSLFSFFIALSIHIVHVGCIATNWCSDT